VENDGDVGGVGESSHGRGVVFNSLWEIGLNSGDDMDNIYAHNINASVTNMYV